MVKDSEGKITTTIFSVNGDYFESLDSLDEQIKNKYVVIKAKSQKAFKINTSFPIQRNQAGKNESTQVFLMDYRPNKANQFFFFSISLLQSQSTIMKFLVLLLIM